MTQLGYSYIALQSVYIILGFDSVYPGEGKHQ